MSLSRRPNKFGLDPFLMMDTAKANYYYGRTDVDSDEDDGRREAVKDALRGKDPELDRSLPWPLLVGGMFKYLYVDAITKYNKDHGNRARDSVPVRSLPPKVIQPADWSDAFNIITANHVKNGLLRRPRKVKEMVTITGRRVALALLLQDPGKGRDKMVDYLSAARRTETVKMLRRMERHRLTLGRKEAVKKHLLDLRPPRGSQE